MNVISLFSGCGGLDLGFERAGLVGNQCNSMPFCRIYLKLT